MLYMWNSLSTNINPRLMSRRKWHQKSCNRLHTKNRHIKKYLGIYGKYIYETLMNSLDFTHHKICVYIYICVCVWICVHACICLHIYSYVYIDTHIYVHTYQIYVYIRIYIYIHTYIYTHIHTCIHNATSKFENSKTANILVPKHFR